jgi:hypothetical protein
MRYTINRFRAGKLDATNMWSGIPLDEVKEHIERSVFAGKADHVEVRDKRNELVAQFP